MKAISNLPENIELDDLMYRLYILEKVSQGQDAINQGKKITLADLQKEIENW